MAKRNVEVSSNIKDLLGGLRKTLGSSSLTDSAFSEVTEFYDTGCYALNRIISGSFYKGIPMGRMCVLFGESQGGKSLIACSTAARAILDGKIDVVFLVDSEGGASRDMFNMFGQVSDKIEHIVVESIEDCSSTIYKLFDLIKTAKNSNPDFKAMIILDSLGALVTRKCLTDIEGDTQKLDRGLRPRLIGDMMRSFTIPALKTNTTMIVLNHIFDDPNAMYPSKVKEMSGGRQVKYLSRLQIQCAKSLNKNETKGESEVYTGTTLKFMCTKNNIVQPFHSCDVEINFKTGYNTKYTGLYDLAIKYGFIKEVTAQSVLVPSYSDKQFRSSKLFNESADEIWGSFIKQLDERQNADIKYGSLIPDEISDDNELHIDEKDAMKLVAE